MDSTSPNITSSTPRRTDSALLLARLSENSVPYQDPLTRVNWDALSQGEFWLPEEAISLYGTPEYQRLSEAQRKILSQYEFLNFIEAGLWLEGLFMERIGRSMCGKRGNIPELMYHLHEMREEAGHSLMFLELLHRSGPLTPNTRFHRFDLSNLLARFAPFDSIVFWVAVLLGEEVPDRMNRFVRKHRDEVCPTIYDIVSIHIMDEARHIVHAKDTLETSFNQAGSLKRRLLQPVINKMFQEFVRTFYIPGAHIYELAGLTPGDKWVKVARSNPHRNQFIDYCADTSLRNLRNHGLNLQWRDIKTAR